MRKTFLFSTCAWLVCPFIPLGLGGNAPGPHRSWRSASASFVPSVSTTMTPYHPWSTKRLFESGIGIRPVEDGPLVPFRYLWAPLEGRMVKEDRCTQRTTLWYAPWGLDCINTFNMTKVHIPSEKLSQTHVSVLTRSWSSCKFIAISSPQGLISIWAIGLLRLAPVRMTRWK